jgi:hypothetical protein
MQCAVTLRPGYGEGKYSSRLTVASTPTMYFVELLFLLNFAVALSGADPSAIQKELEITERLLIVLHA